MSAYFSQLNVALRKMDHLNRGELHLNQRKSYDYFLNIGMK